MALTVVKSCTKLGLTGGAVYWSYQQGVWGSPQEGADAMKRFKTTILSTDASYPPTPAKVQTAAPQSSEGVISSTWNRGAKTVFECLRDVPEYTGKATSSVTNFVQESFKS